MLRFFSIPYKINISKEIKENSHESKIENNSAFHESRYSDPVIGMIRRSIINHAVDYDTLQDLIRDYHLAIFKATLKSLACEVVEISPDSFFHYAYLRDRAVLLHDKKLIILPQDDDKMFSVEMAKKLHEKTGYSYRFIENTYFEGGNVIYASQKKLLFHGIDPDGHYGHGKNGPLFYATPREEYYKIDPKKTNQLLQNELAQHQIMVKGLGLNPEVLSYNSGRVLKNYYFHLDCFMHLLPDGRLIILNKKILS